MRIACVLLAGAGIGVASASPPGDLNGDGVNTAYHTPVMEGHFNSSEPLAAAKHPLAEVYGDGAAGDAEMTTLADDRCAPPLEPIEHSSGVREGGSNIREAGISETRKHYIITLQDGVNFDAFIKEHQFEPRHQYRSFNGFSNDLSTAELELLRRDRQRVLVIEEDGPVSISAPAQDPSSGLKRMDLQSFPLSRINNQTEPLDVDVAIIDTGIDPHEDLNIFQNHRVFSLDYNDSVGHGTSVAGVIAALDNNLGTVGVASGVRIWNIKAIGPPPNNAWSYVISALNYVHQNASQIDVLNMSLTNEGANAPYNSLRLMSQRLVRSGVVVVAAAGNKHRDLAGSDLVFGNGDDALPASLPEVMAVSAMDSSLDAESKSADHFWVSTPGTLGTNYSSVPRSIPIDNPDPTVVYPVSNGGAIDVAAPGVNILVPAAGLDGDGVGRNYASVTGTSFAAPHVTGLVALYIAANGRAHDEKGVYRIRQAIIDQSQALQPQSAWGNDPQDPDNQKEALAFPSSAWVPHPKLDLVRSGDGKKLTLRTAALGESHTPPYSVPGYTYTLQCSPNLVSWSDLTSFVGDGNYFEYVDDVADIPRRFYRTRITPTP